LRPRSRGIRLSDEVAAAIAEALAKPDGVVVQSHYEEVVVLGNECVRVRSSPEAYAHRLAVALPRMVVPALPSRIRPRTNKAVGAPDGGWTCHADRAFNRRLRGA
jgi:hypothetical protein